MELDRGYEPANRDPTGLQAALEASGESPDRYSTAAKRPQADSGDEGNRNLGQDGKCGEFALHSRISHVVFPVAASWAVLLVGHHFFRRRLQIL